MRALPAWLPPSCSIMLAGLCCSRGCSSALALPIAPRDRLVSVAVPLLGGVQVLPLLTACDVAGAGV